MALLVAQRGYCFDDDAPASAADLEWPANAYCDALEAEREARRIRRRRGPSPRAARVA